MPRQRLGSRSTLLTSAESTSTKTGWIRTVIKEQYMVPDHGYIQALTDASANCKRLIIVLPSFLEIFFGDIRRTQMFQQWAGTTMAPKWGDRMVIGTPMRRPVLAAANRVTSVGRCTLLQDIGQFDATVFLGP